ncbi:hypothetical protein [Microbacterium enclense]
MTPEEALAAIRAEGLGDYRWFEDATNATVVVVIQRAGRNTCSRSAPT